MLTVLAVTAGWREDGALRISPFVEDQIAALRRTGCRVHVGAVEDRLSPTSTLADVLSFRSTVERERVDVVHAHYGSMIAMLGLAARRKAAYVVSFGGSDLLGVPHDTAYWRARQRIALMCSLRASRAADAIIVKAPHLIDALPQETRSKAVVIPNGVDTDRFIPEDRAACRRLLGWDVEAPTVVINGSRGNNVYVKNVKLAEEAVARAQLTLPGLRLVIIGNEPSARMPLFMNAADCLLVTSLHEGSPNVVKEAMACNLPVVSVPCGDVQERLSGPDVGLVRPFDAPSLSDALLAYIRPPVRSNGRNALFAQGLDGPTVASRLASLLGRLAGAR